MVKPEWGEAEFLDDAGHPITETRIMRMLAETIRQMSTGELIDLLMGEWAWNVNSIPDDMVKCPCHGWWYDLCPEYA